MLIPVLIVFQFLFLRFLWVWTHPRLPPKNKPQPVRNVQKRPIIVVLGSGGHTGEMLMTFRQLPKGIWAVQDPSYVISATDKDSEDVAHKFELDVLGRKAKVCRIPRAREVGQSYLSSIFSTIHAFWCSLIVVWQVNPDAIITNGPGVCVPVVFSSFAIATLFPFRSRATVAYFESFTCVDHLSLSGRILKPFADLFTVQWPDFAAKLGGQIEYTGPFVEGAPLPPMQPNGFFSTPNEKLPRIAVVTVGSTCFDELMTAIDSTNFLAALETLKIKEVLIQKGRSQVKFRHLSSEASIPCTVVEYKPHLGQVIRNASLVISHAGAGTILEAIGSRVPLVVVPNSQLMGNHQRPLADALHKRGHLVCVEAQKLVESLPQMPFEGLLEFPSPNAIAIRRVFEKLF